MMTHASEQRARGHRITTFRGFPPFRRAVTARDVRALWERRLASAAPAHPVWLHVHVPYCPQICAFCHCGKQLLTNDDQLDEWLERTRAEVEYFGPVLRSARIRNIYFGGGTPNLLSPAQLDTLLNLLERNLDLDDAGRRTLEMLPSVHKPGTLEVAAAHGIRRLSCGVQSTSSQLLRPVGRLPDFAPLAAIMKEAHERGIEDINVDLAWGLKGDSERVFFESLRDVLRLGPTSVSTHLLIPTANFPVFGSEAEEISLYRRFRALGFGEHAEKLSESHPEYEFRLLPTVLVAVRRDYVERGEYYSWQYSDMETVGIDSFGLGRFAQSHLIGWARYENMTAIGTFAEDEAGYQAVEVDGTVDGAMDALGALVRDGACDLATVGARYTPDAMRPVSEVLDALVSAGELTFTDGKYRYERDDSILFGPAGDLADLATERARALNRDAATARTSDRRSQRFDVGVGELRIPIVLERAKPGARYYKVVGEFGVSHDRVEGVAHTALEGAMQDIIRSLGEIVVGRSLTLAQVRTELLQRFS